MNHSRDSVMLIACCTHPHYQLSDRVCLCVKTAELFNNCFCDWGKDQYRSIQKNFCSDFSSVIISIVVVYGCVDNYM